MIPPIPAVTPPEGAAGPRPLLSVMVPTYHCAPYLGEALSSILAQDLGPEKMQIEVVDDVSTADDPARVVEEIGRGRVAFFRHPQNVGAARNMNTCLHRARGEWVHILHGDDYLLEGFYAEFQRLAAAHPEAQSIAIRSFLVDPAGVQLDISPYFDLPDCHHRLRDQFVTDLRGSPVEFCGMIVRRALFEQVGGFHEALAHTHDIEMWSRLLLNHPAAFTARSLACYRLHELSDTNAHMKSGSNILERRNVLPHLAKNTGFTPTHEKRYREVLHLKAYLQALRFAVAGDFASMLANVRAYAASTRTLRERLLFLRRCLPLVLRSGAKHLARPRRA